MAYATADEEPSSNMSKNVVLSGGPHFHTLIFKGVVQGKAITVLVDVVATHNFIDSSFMMFPPCTHLGVKCNRNIQEARCVLGGKSQVKYCHLILTPLFRAQY